MRSRGLRRLDNPVELASGDWSRYFIDVKRALADGGDMNLAAQVVRQTATDLGADFDVVGGMTMGADVLAYGVAAACGRGVRWFSVRKAAKARGTAQRIEGAILGPGDRVLLLDDVVTRAGSIVDALAAVTESGAKVVAAIALVDRGEFGRLALATAGVTYRPIMTYTDLGLPPVGSEPGPVSN
ncbi:MAG: orotate phosphoribosyltransferase [Acidimicrobiales bacterium]